MRPTSTRPASMRQASRPLNRARLLRAAVLAMSTALVAPAVAVSWTPAQAAPAPDGFADLAQRLLPAVVNISSTQTLTARSGGDEEAGPSGPGAGPEMPTFPPGSPFEKLFRDFMNRNHPGGNGGGGGGQEPARKVQSLGSGFIIDPSGIVVTNNHVIKGADEITVTLQDNTTLKAKVVGHDDRTDIAVLQVKSDKQLPFLPFADSTASRVGDWVLAIGNPFGLGGTVTAGIVSARGRDIQQGPYDDFIQTDAAINRGNSGGPLFNLAGEVIGINTAIFSPSGGSIGLGFSIPSNLAKTVVAQLRNFGHARRGWLGVKIQQVTPDIAESLGRKDPTGALVAGVEDNGPAARAKLRNGDIILTFNGQDIREMKALPRTVAETEINKQVPLVVWRDGKQVTLQVKVGELPEDATALANAPAPVENLTPQPLKLSGLGLELSPMTPDARKKYSIGADQKGVLITGVTDGTPAAERGLKAGDVVVEVQQEEVTTPADAQSKIETARKAGRPAVLLLVQGQDGMRYVPISLKPDGKRQPG